MGSRLDRRIARLESRIPRDADVTRLSQAELIAGVIASWHATLTDPDADPELAQSAAACLAYKWDDRDPWSNAQIATFRNDMVLLERKLSRAK